MAVSGLKKSTALAALVFALAGLGAPTFALADEDQDGGRRGGWAERRGGGEAPGQVGEQRSWQRQQSQAPAPQPAPQQRAWNGGQGSGGGWQGRQAAPPPQVQSQAPAPRAWGGGQGDGQRGGWQGRRQNTESVAQSAPEAPRSGMFGRRDRSGGDGDGERRNRNWGGGGQGGQQGWSRPAPTPVPQAESRTVTNEQPRENWRSRNGGYTDPNRNGSYRDNRRDDNNRNWRDGERRRDGGGYADGRRWDGDNRRGDNDRWRDGRRWDRDERGWNNFGRDRNDNDRRRHGPGSSGYNPNRSGSWWNSYGYNGSWRNNRHSYYNNGSWRRWNRDWRHDRRYDWYGWRNSHSDWFRLDYYYAPYRNYSYRRLSIGFFLDALFYSERYWIDDPWQYRLPEVYGPYRWVRYYDDALLVDIYTGEVVDVIHDFFW